MLILGVEGLKGLNLEAESSHMKFFVYPTLPRGGVG